MTRVSAGHIATASLAVLLAVPIVTAQTPLPAITPPGIANAASPATSNAEPPGISQAEPPALSRARIVRLSEVKGQVKVDRAVGSGFEPAIANLPIVENCRIVTFNGVAEVEFEDNSTLRLGPDTEVEFPALERMPSGGTISSVRVLHGMAYVSLMKTPENQFNLLFGQQSLALPPASHVRLQMEKADARLAVLDGAVGIKASDGTEDVPHKRTVTFALAGSTEPTVAKSVESNPFDVWDRNADQYHAKVAAMSAMSNSPYAYGVNDLMYYGNFANMGGCGMMWRPYFASAAWDPYSNGMWAWYGNGMGYSWVSPYPWGWMPYHFGTWSFCPGAGWGWMPGGSWMGVNNTAVFPHLRGPIIIPKAPIRAPRLGEPGLVMVNQKPLIRSEVNSSSSFVFRKDSAGMGIPRNELGKLNKFSEHAEMHGTARMDVYMQAPATVGANGRTTYAGVESIRRGSPSEVEGSRSEMRGENRGPSGSGGSNPGASGGSPSSSRSFSPMPSGDRPSGPPPSSAPSGGNHSDPSGRGR